jgi:TPR repeat protein
LKLIKLFLNKIHSLSWSRLFILLAALTILGVVILGAFRLQPHYLSSKEAFLGNFYRGKIVPFIHDNERAKKYLAKAIKNNNNEAVCDLGEIYAQENDYQLAGFNYFAAAMGGSQRCEVHLMKFSFSDEKGAYQFLKKMADEKRYASAYFMVGKRLIEGLGVSKDTKTGIAYLEKAVAQEHWGAKLYLAGIYIKGELLPQDIDKANELMGVENKIGEKK